MALCLAGGVPALAQPGKGPAPDFAALAARAEAARDADRTEDAIVLYRKAVELRPGWGEGWWSLAMLEYEGRAFDKSAEAFRKAADLNPKNGLARAMLGLSEFELGQDASALRHIREGKDLGLPDDPQLRNVVLYHEGELLRRAGMFQEALQRLHSLCFAGVRNPDLLQALGLVALWRSEMDPPRDRDAEVVARVGRAECLAGQKKFDEARQEYAAVARDYPTYRNIHYAYGWFLLGAEDMPAGYAELEQEIKNNPRHVMARLQIAATRYKVDSAAGLRYAEEAVKLDPQSVLGHYLLGLLLLDTDDYRRAIPELEMVQKAQPGFAKAYLALGAAYARAGREEDAARARATFQRLKQDAGKEPELMPAPEQ
ncbi:MAG: tetratricopeptide repeat protein [Bryobacteraceae bacterium]